MPTTYDSLATTTLGSNTQTVTFSNISSAYTDLKIIVGNLRMSVDNSSNITLFVNGDTNTNYSYRNIWNNASSIGSQGFQNTFRIVLNYGNLQLSSTQPAMVEIDMLNYSGSTNKTFLSRFSGDKNGTLSGLTAQVGLWRSTAAINSVSFYGDGCDISSGTVISIYGILRA